MAVLYSALYTNVLRAVSKYVREYDLKTLTVREYDLKTLRFSTVNCQLNVCMFKERMRRSSYNKSYEK